jgi:hypothetical protein
MKLRDYYVVLRQTSRHGSAAQRLYGTAQWQKYGFEVTNHRLATQHEVGWIKLQLPVHFFRQKENGTHVAEIPQKTLPAAVGPSRTAHGRSYTPALYSKTAGNMPLSR